jgi:hypothetical protein
MPEHVHLLLTPANDVTLERAFNWSKVDTRTHSGLSSDAGRFGKEDLLITEFAMTRTFSGITITFIRIP